MFDSTKESPQKMSLLPRHILENDVFLQLDPKSQASLQCFLNEIDVVYKPEIHNTIKFRTEDKSEMEIRHTVVYFFKPKSYDSSSRKPNPYILQLERGPNNSLLVCDYLETPGDALSVPAYLFREDGPTLNEFVVSKLTEGFYAKLGDLISPALEILLANGRRCFILEWNRSLYRYYPETGVWSRPITDGPRDLQLGLEINFTSFLNLSALEYDAYQGDRPPLSSLRLRGRGLAFPTIAKFGNCILVVTDCGRVYTVDHNFVLRGECFWARAQGRTAVGRDYTDQYRLVSHGRNIYLLKFCTQREMLAYKIEDTGHGITWKRVHDLDGLTLCLMKIVAFVVPPNYFDIPFVEDTSLVLYDEYLQATADVYWIKDFDTLGLEESDIVLSHPHVFSDERRVQVVQDVRSRSPYLGRIFFPAGGLNLCHSKKFGPHKTVDDWVYGLHDDFF